MRHVRLMAVSAATLVVAVGLAGCVPPGEHESPPTVQVDTPKVPASLQQPQDLIYADGLLPATGSLPFALGGDLQKPGSAPAPTVWTSDDGLTWAATAVDPKFSGAFSGQLRGDDTLTALAGTAWTDGEFSSVLWTSKNRSTWKRIDLPGDFADTYRIADFAVHGRDILLIGRDTAGKLAGLLVSGSKTTKVTLPKPPKGEKLSPLAVAWGDDDRAVLLAESAAEGDSGPAVAYTSRAGGVKWTGKPATVYERADSVRGMVWTGSAYVATGSVYASDTAGAPLVPAAWSSPDGEAWAAEKVPLSSSTETGYRKTDAWFGNPSVGPDGLVGAVMANDNSALSAVYQRTTAGRWSFVADTSTNEGNGVEGLAVPLESGRLVGAIGTEGAVRFGVAAPRWKDGTKLNTTARSAYVTDIQETPDGALVTLSRSVFTVKPDLSWKNSSQASQASVSAKGVVEDAAWDPPEASGLINLVGGTHDDEQVLLGSDFSKGSQIITRGWYRASPDAPWQAVTGFPRKGATGLSAVEHVGDVWVATGYYRQSSNVGTPQHALVWTSTDGVTWSQAAGDFGSGGLETGTDDVCANRAGDPLVLGWRETKPGEYAITAWSATDATWAAVDLGKFDDRPGTAYSCTEGKDGLLLSIDFGGRSVLLLETKKGWKQVFRAGEDDLLSEPVAVPGGYAASGSWSDGNESHPVVWLSADARTWKPVAVPSLRSGSTSRVAALGDDLIVTMSGVTGPAVSIVRDVEKVIGQYAKG